MEAQTKALLEQWKATRKLLLDVLEIIPEQDLGFTVGQNMGTLGKQYRHMGDVQLCYNEAIRTGRINFSHYRRDYSLETSKEGLAQFLRDADASMFRLIEEKPDARIDWFGQEWDLNSHIQALIGHEILHQGQMVVYIRTLGLKFPESWEFWGL